MSARAILGAIFWAMGCTPFTAAQEVRPPRLPYLDAPAFLAAERGAWTYDFGTPGWPDAWSPHGLDPMQVGVTLQGMRFNDPVTGRPLFELLPYDKLLRLDRVGLVVGRPEGLEAELAPYGELQPITEMVYRSTTSGLQQVSVVHAQTRRAGQAGRAQYLFGYSGAGARGEYDGSRLRRKRQVLFRVKRESERFRIEIGEMFNRHRVGAQGGVVPFAGFTYESIYERIGAQTRNPSDIRQLARNDLWVEAGLPRVGLTARAYWNVSTLTFRAPSDTLEARVSRIGLDARQAAGRFFVRAAGSVDAYPDRNAWARTPDPAWEAAALGGGTHRIGAGLVDWQAGVLAYDFGAGSEVVPTFSANLTWEAGIIRPFVHSRNGVSLGSAADRYGFGGTLSPDASVATGRQAVDEIGISFRPAWLHLQASVAATRQQDGVVRLGDAQADTVTVVSYSGLRTRTSGTIRLGLREFSTRGLYFWAEGTAGTYSGEDPLLDARLEQAVPDVFGNAALGFRGLFFSGDLDGDLSLRARGWTAHRGMRLHTETGLLVLATEDSRPVEQSFILDVVGIAHVRTATLTLSLENILSGTTLTPGNQLIPDYPYPERRLRFSVFWPILN